MFFLIQIDRLTEVYIIVVIAFSNCFFFLILVSDEKETMPYVAAHFEQQLELYKTLVGLLYQILHLSLSEG